MSENKLELLVRDSGLVPAKAQFILERFQDYFKIAAEWEVKARAVVVRDEHDRTSMDMARVGRLFLREKRVAIEKARKELKEQALREGKAIDGIANVLKALIEPIEEYLDQQEHFIEIKAAAEAEAKRIEDERRMEEERIAKEKAITEENERIRVENERLRKEAAEKEAALKAERERNEQARKAAEEKARREQEAKERELAAAKAEAAAKQKALEDKARKEREKAEAEKKAAEEKVKAEKRRLEIVLASQIECPYCRKKFTRKQ